MTRKMTATIVVAALIAAGGLAYAQGPGFGGPRGRGPGGPGMGAGMLLRGLDLTEAQRQQIRQLTEQHREATRTIAERLQAARAARQEAMTATPTNEAQIRAAVQQEADVEADLAVQQARLMADVRAVLTPEQLQQVEARRTQREARMQERRERMQQRMQERQQN